MNNRTFQWTIKTNELEFNKKFTIAKCKQFIKDLEDDNFAYVEFIVKTNQEEKIITNKICQ